MKKHKQIILLLLLVVVFYIGHTLGRFYENSYGTLLGNKILWMFDNYTSYNIIDFKFTIISLYTGLTSLLIFALIYIRFFKNNKKYRYGEEHGSAKYATIEEIKIFEDKEEKNNINFPNPYISLFKYIEKETDIDKVAKEIVNLTKKPDNRVEDFWIQAEIIFIKELSDTLEKIVKVENFNSIEEAPEEQTLSEKLNFYKEKYKKYEEQFMNKYKVVDIDIHKGEKKL